MRIETEQDTSNIRVIGENPGRKNERNSLVVAGM